MLPALFILLTADAPAYPNARLLVEADALAKPGAAKEFRILDARPKAQYQTGHVPGAVWVDVAAWAKVVAEKPDDAGWPARLAGVGIAPTSAVLVYSADLRDAARVWWILKYVGVADVRILNGHWPAWLEGKFPVETTENSPKADPAEWKTQRVRLTTKNDVLQLLKAPAAQLLDVRTVGEFRGETKQAKRAGNIPGAIHLEWTDLLDAKRTKFKPADELKKILDGRKIDLDKPCVTYCQVGVRASVVAFGLELMGGKQVSNYFRSWSEWGNLDATPIETKAKP